jgi:Phosphotransferase enzyme family
MRTGCPQEMIESQDSPDTAQAIAALVLGRDPGPMVIAPSDSHHVYVSADIVVKIIDVERHSRLEREVALAPHLPLGLMPRLLSSGLYELGTSTIRYACYDRAPGTAPGMGMPGVDALSASLLAEQAVARLDELHRWTPTDDARQTLGEPLYHGGFVSRTNLVAMVENLAGLNRDDMIARPLIDGLIEIAERAPLRALRDVPVHADCHWGNWLVLDRRVTALLDFEWARFGEPLDDWFFLVRFSGPHMAAVLDIISHSTLTSPETLRAGCEVREAAHLANDLCFALGHPSTHERMAAVRLAALEELVIERYWWRGAE